MESAPPPEIADFKTFLETIAPGKWVRIKKLATAESSRTVRLDGFVYQESKIAVPALYLYCESEECGGPRYFESNNRSLEVSNDGLYDEILHVTCRNCGKFTKTFALRVQIEDNGEDGRVKKFGELPSFGPPTPARLIALIGRDRDYFLKGRRAENQGLGIGAFSYYRRVVENQKNRIFDETIRVAATQPGADAVIEDLKRAKVETQFSKAVGQIKHALPGSLLINGNNPLMLLHAALSEGLHAETDAQCLELATSIRVVITDLSERLAAALKEEAELQAAVSRLLNKKSAPKKPPTDTEPS